MSDKPSAEDTEFLEANLCWDLLRDVSVGHLAVWVVDHPDIFPINYKVDHGTVVFRTGEGTKLQAVSGMTPVALEADGFNETTRVAWSVVVKGHAATIDPRDVLDNVGLVLFPWQAGNKENFVRITPTSITGRRFKVTSPLTWWSSLDDATRAGLE